MADVGKAPARREQYDGGSTGCFVRLGWMIVGNIALLIVAAKILQESRWTLTLKDVLFWGIVAALIALRYVDVTRLGGRTANDEVATIRHFRRYAAVLVVVSTAIWTLVQSFGYAG